MKVKKTPLRMCVSCQQMKPKKELVRVVCTPEDEIILDPTGKKSGRGSYLCLNTECIKKAEKSKSLERTLKNVVPVDIYAQLAEKAKGCEDATT